MHIGIADERLIYLNDGRAKISLSMFNGEDFDVDILGIESLRIEGQPVKILATDLPSVIAPKTKVVARVEVMLPLSLWLGIEAGTANEKLNTAIEIECAYPYKKLIS